MHSASVARGNVSSCPRNETALTVYSHWYRQSSSPYTGDMRAYANRILSLSDTPAAGSLNALLDG